MQIKKPAAFGQTGAERLFVIEKILFGLIGMH